MKRAASLVATCMALAAFGQPASAVAAPPPVPFFAEYKQIALRYYTPLCWPVDDLYDGPMENENAVAEAHLHTFLCKVTYAPVFITLSRERQCNVVVHEYGHMEDLYHSAGPTSIMHWTAPSVIPECQIFSHATTTKVKKHKRKKRRRHKRRHHNPQGGSH